MEEGEGSSLLISTPMKAKGAQEASAHGLWKGYCQTFREMGRKRDDTYMPHIETSVVANRSEVTNGARAIEPAKMRWEIIHAVMRSGLYSLIFVTIGAMLGGGRGVKPGFSSSGERTTHGSSTDPAKVMMEKTMRERLPIRPISPRASLDSCAVFGAS